MANTTAALIQNWSTVEDVIKSTQNAVGSADAENEKYLDSIEGKLAQFQAQFQETSTNILSSGLVKGTIDVGSGILGFLNTLTEKLGTIPGLIAPLTQLFLSLTGKTLFGKPDTSGNILNTLKTLVTNGGIGKSIKNWATSGQKSVIDDYKNLLTYFKGGQTLTGVDFEKMFSGASAQTRAFAKNLDVAGTSYDQLKTKAKDFTKAQLQVNSAGSKIKSVFSGLGSALLGMAAAAAVTLTISAIVSAIDKYNMSAQEAAEVTQNALSKYDDARSKIDDNISSVDNLRERFEELSKGVSDNGKNISLSADQYQEYQDIVSQLVDINPSLIRGYNDEQQAIIDKNNAIQQTIELLKQQRMQEARDAVYGGIGTNDGKKKNYEAAYIDFQNQYKTAKSGVDVVDNDIFNYLARVEAAMTNAGKSQSEEFANIISNAIGMSYDEYAEKIKKASHGTQEVTWLNYLSDNDEALGKNFGSILGQLNQMHGMTNDLASDGAALAQEWQSAAASVDATSSSFRQMLQAAYEASNQYQSLSDDQKNFLSQYVENIDTEALYDAGNPDVAMKYANAMLQVVKNTKAGSEAVEKYNDLISKQDEMPYTDYIREMGDVISSTRDELSKYLSDDELNAIDLSKVFGLDQFQSDMYSLRQTIRENFKDLFDGAEFDGTSLEEMLSGLNLEELSRNQLSALNSALIDTGDRASEFAARLAALAQVGALPEALDAISKSLESQSDSLQTVSGALQDYETAMEGITDHVQDHESMVSIYDDFAEAVNKGQINTEEARNQMDLLIGKVVSLDEARQWVKDNKGLFLTGTDEDNVGQDLTGALNTLQSKYNQLSEDKKSIVDGLMNVDWDTGSIQVAQHDVVALADAFGISAASMQQALDLISTYGDYAPRTVSSVTSDIKTLNDSVYSMKQQISDADQATTKAWDHMDAGAKTALEALTEGMDIDITSMSVTEMDELVAAMNSFKASIGGETPTFDSLKTSLEGVKTSAGDAAAEVTRLSDGSWSIDVSDISAFASSLGMTEDKARIVLNTLAQIRDENGNPIQLTIEGNTVDAEKKGNAIDEALAPIERERGINIETSNANRAINTLKVKLDSTLGHLSYAINFTTGSVPNAPTYNGTTTYTSKSGGSTRNPRNQTSGHSYTGDYAGHVGKMTQYATGGNAVGGKTLVGELGPEQWISRDGKHSKFVGLHGMEVIDTKPGDAIVPANLTAGLMHGGIPHQAYNIWGGVSASNPRKNLINATGGTFTDYKPSNSKSQNFSNSESTTVKADVTADTSKLDDAMKETLDKIKDEVDDIIDQLEHKIYLLEEQHGDPLQIVAYYKQIQDEAKKAADKFRAQGQKDSSEYVRTQQKQWWEAHDKIIETMKDMYDKITSEHENAIKLLENQLDRALDTDKINKAYQRTVRLKVDTEQLNSVQSIMKETSTAAANSLVKLGLGFGSLASAMASAQRVINSLQPVTVDIISSSIDGDAIEDYMNQTIEHYRAMQENIHKEADYYRSQGYSDLSDEVSELSDKWWEYEDAVKDVKQKVIDYLSDIVDKASESVDEIQDVLSTFKDAAKEYSTNGGFISVDTFQEIVKLGPEYLGYLQDENGLLTINEDAINRVIKAKTEQMALESAMAYVERLRLALQSDSIEDLNKLLTATADLTECQWGAVYAQLAMLDLTDDGYAQALHNINALRSLADNAMSGVGLDFDDSKDAIDDLFKYVEDMIKDEIDKQVDALEELKDKYSEIIDLKKESLQASKDEADYQDEVADKVKEMAKLQEKINALALDDSRSSVAKRKELEEQLADAQKELSKTQADEAYDKQTDNLDKMQEAYEKQKDAEIKKLQDSISSEEKLYQLARERIKNGWATLYDDLIDYNTRAGSVINDQITAAWENAQKAMEKYNATYLEVYDKIGSNSSGSISGSSGSSNIVGPSNKYADSGDGNAQLIVDQMKKNSEAWKETNSQDERDALHAANDKLKDQLKKKYKLEVNYNEKTGVWEVDKDKENIYNRYLGVYHNGGVVGDASTLRQDEMMAVLQKGEIVLDAKKQKSLDSLMRIASAITTGINSKFVSPSAHVLEGVKAGYNRDAVPTTTNNQSVNISFGDTIINGEKGDTLKQHEAINRRMVNDIIDVLKLKK